MSKRNWKKSNKKGNGKKNNSTIQNPNVKDAMHLTDTGGDSKDTPSGSTSAKLSSLNDISWYSRYPELLSAASNIPFPYKAGMTIPVGSAAAYSGSDLTYASYTYDLPGVLSIDWVPSMPQSSSATDPAGIAAREIYARVRQVYSGRLYADGPDMLIYLLALDSINIYIGWLNRIYKTLCVYTPENFYTPDTLLESYGLNSQSILNLKQDQMKFYQIICELVHMVGRFNCPKFMDLFDRHYWMTMNVYSDSPNLNSQLYVMNPYAVFQFELVNTPEAVPAGGLKLVRLPTNTVVDADDLFTFGRTLIDSLSGWEDAYTISGYLARAFENTPFFVPEFPVMGDAITFEFQEEVLSQIENAYCDGFLPYSDIGNGVLTISQDPSTNSLIWTPYVVNAGMPGISTYRMDGLKSFINLHSSKPTAEETVIATRLRCPVDTRSVANNVFPLPNSNYPVITGTEWIGGFKVWTSAAGTYQTFVSDLPVNISAAEDLSASITNTLQLMSILRSFDWAPCVKTIFYGLDGTTRYNAGVAYSWDIWNTTLLSNEDLKNIHRICTYSEFNSFSI